MDGGWRGVARLPASAVRSRVPARAVARLPDAGTLLFHRRGAGSTVGRAVCGSRRVVEGGAERLGRPGLESVSFRLSAVLGAVVNTAPTRPWMGAGGGERGSVCQRRARRGTLCFTVAEPGEKRGETGRGERVSSPASKRCVHGSWRAGGDPRCGRLSERRAAGEERRRPSEPRSVGGGAEGDGAS